MGTEIINAEKLTKAVENLNYRPNSRYVKALASVTNEWFSDKYTAAMFLAQCAHETSGYSKIEESSNGESEGKSYHARGFLRLSSPETYRQASKDIGNEDLYEKPEKVAEDEYLGARASVWYWKNVVQKYPGFSPIQNFGITTKAINGKEECNGENVDKSKNRYTCYLEMCKMMGIKPADESGCYN